MTRRRTSTTNRRSRNLRNKKTGHLLEVKMRTDTARRQRTRKIHTAFAKIFFVALLLGASLVGGRLLMDKFFFKNPDYNVQHLNTSLDGVLTLSELKKTTGLTEGKNIFYFNLNTIEKKLNDLPNVKKAHVERILPNTIQVSIERRLPILRLATSSAEPFIPGQSLMIDQEGVVFSPEKLESNLLELPILEGVNTANIYAGQQLKEEMVVFAIALWKAINNAGNITLTPRSFDVSRGYCVTVTDSTDAQFIFGPEDIPGQMERLQKLLTHCQETGRKVATANLILEHNTPVTFRMNK